MLNRSGTPVGAVKHVWLIILENKSYDATFTGLNQNSYLWKTLPSQGALLKNYYGTGHFSLDNYTSMVSGQGPAPADQNDCPIYADKHGSVVTNSKTKDGPTTDRGQFAETGAPYANPVPGGADEGAHGGTGCVYPASVPTLFNQFDAAGVSWKGYAQDLGNPDATGPTHDVNKCGGPGDPSGAGVHQPRLGQRDRPVRAEALPVPVVRVAADQPDRLHVVPDRQPRQLDQRSGARPAERGDHSGVQLDHAGQLLGRPRRHLRRQQPLRRVRRVGQPGVPAVRPAAPTSPRRRRRPTTPAACTRRTCS